MGFSTFSGLKFQRESVGIAEARVRGCCFEVKQAVRVRNI
jgi:hypothetical protein